MKPQPTATNQFTKGPWTNHTGDYGIYDESRKLLVARVYDTTKGESEANARLIAAAPELLAAAQKTLAFLKDLSKSNPGFMGKLVLQDYAQWNEAMIELPAAITKATKATAQAGGE